MYITILVCCCCSHCMWVHTEGWRNCPVNSALINMPQTTFVQSCNGSNQRQLAVQAHCDVCVVAEAGKLRRKQHKASLRCCQHVILRSVLMHTPATERSGGQSRSSYDALQA